MKSLIVSSGEPCSRGTPFTHRYVYLFPLTSDIEAISAEISRDGLVLRFQIRYRQYVSFGAKLDYLEHVLGPSQTPYGYAWARGPTVLRLSYNGSGSDFPVTTTVDDRGVVEHCYPLP